MGGWGGWRPYPSDGLYNDGKSPELETIQRLITTGVCVCVWGGGVDVCVCVCERERERERESVCFKY